MRCITLVLVATILLALIASSEARHRIKHGRREHNRRDEWDIDEWDTDEWDRPRHGPKRRPQRRPEPRPERDPLPYPFNGVNDEEQNLLLEVILNGKNYCEDGPYEPVCGTDDKTYRNIETLKRVAETKKCLELRHDGPCLTKCQRENCFCPYIYRPVCGCDGVTYGNECTFRCAKCDKPYINIVKESACCEKKPCECIEIYQPVCGTNGQTYANSCFLECDAQCTDLKLDYEGECRCVSDRVCPAVYEPVCGSNGRTYPSECDLLAAADCDTELKVGYQGMCREDRTSAE